MKIWVDADAFPTAVKDVVVKAAHKLGVATVFVANKATMVPESVHISTVLVSAGSDVADQYICEHAEQGDLAITHDILMASKLVAKGVVVIDPRGDCYTEENIAERVSIRDLMHGLRSAGEIGGGPGQFGDKEKRKFANAFNREITRLLKSPK